MSLTFDGNNKLIICGAGTTGITLPDLWSRYKDWLLTGNAGFALAFETVGGDPIDATTLVPLYLFLKNGWKIRPQEATHSLKVTDGILVVDGGGDPFASTIGTFAVRILFSQPVQAFGYSTTGNVNAGATPDQIASAVRAELAIELAKIDASVSSRMAAGEGSGGASATEVADAVRTNLTVELANLDAKVSSRVAQIAVTPAKVRSVDNVIVTNGGGDPIAYGLIPVPLPTNKPDPFG